MRVFWNEDEFTESELVHLIMKFGMQPIEILYEEDNWVWFSSKFKMMKTKPSNFKKLN